MGFSNYYTHSLAHTHFSSKTPYLEIRKENLMRPMTERVNVINRPSLRPIHLKILRHLAHANVLCSALAGLDYCDENGDPKDTSLHVAYTADELSEEIGESLRSTRKACNELVAMSYIDASTADSPEGGRGRKPVYYFFKGDFFSAFVLDKKDNRNYLEAKVFEDERFAMLFDHINSIPIKGEILRKAEEDNVKKMEERRKKRKRGGWPSGKSK